MKLWIGLAEFFGLVTSQSDESEIDSYGVGAVMPNDSYSLLAATLDSSEANARD